MGMPKTVKNRGAKNKPSKPAPDANRRAREEALLAKPARPKPASQTVGDAPITTTNTASDATRDETELLDAMRGAKKRARQT